MLVKRCLVSVLVAVFALAGSGCDTGDQVATPQSAAAFHESVGVGIHVSYWDTAYGQADRVADSLAELGVRHVRDGMSLSTDPAWNDILYRHLATVAARGIKFTYIFDLRP